MLLSGVFGAHQLRTCLPSPVRAVEQRPHSKCLDEQKEQFPSSLAANGSSPTGCCKACVNMYQARTRVGAKDCTKERICPGSVDACREFDPSAWRTKLLRNGKGWVLLLEMLQILTIAGSSGCLEERVNNRDRLVGGDVHGVHKHGAAGNPVGPFKSSRAPIKVLSAQGTVNRVWRSHLAALLPK